VLKRVGNRRKAEDRGVSFRVSKKSPLDAPLAREKRNIGSNLEETSRRMGVNATLHYGGEYEANGNHEKGGILSKRKKKNSLSDRGGLNWLIRRAER